MKITICTLFALLSAMPSMINAQEQEPKVNFNVTLVSQWYDANYGYDSTGPPENHPANISIDGQGWKYVGELTFAELGPTNGRNFTVERQKTEWPGQLGKICTVTIEKDPGADLVSAYIKMDQNDTIVSDHEKEVHVKCEDGDVSKVVVPGGGDDKIIGSSVIYTLPSGPISPPHTVVTGGTAEPPADPKTSDEHSTSSTKVPAAGETGVSDDATPSPTKV